MNSAILGTVQKIAYILLQPKICRIMRKSILTLIISALVCLNSFGAEESAADSIQTKTLDEFVVKGNKKIVKNEGPKTTILISGTPYGNYLDLTSMLNHLPGMMPSGSGPEVIGAGTPIFCRWT